mmetsp:Transcript_10809/g.32811  ORF Transcript_10809/g.32811 Transcript_10809/m.32811 type:complete len:224 (-) Transcript_10809:379-1050(-)
MTILPRRSRMSSREVVRASTAMISEATVMSKPVARGVPLPSFGPVPTVTPRTWRSHVSSTRCQVMVSGSMSRRAKRPLSSGDMAAGSRSVMPSFSRRRIWAGQKRFTPSFLEAGTRRLKSCSSVWVPSWNMRVSMAAAQRLFAAVMAWMSPVRWRLKSSIGTTWEKPPPAAPPLMPKVGPWDGWRMQVNVFLFRWAPSAWHTPMVVVDLPSPSGVGLMPVTTT